MDYAEKPSLGLKLRRFSGECIRVLRITKKPTKDEYKTIVKVAGLGVIALGLIGFLIQMAKILITK